MVAVAAAAGIPVETLRKIESGRVPTPTFFTVAAIAAELGIPLDDVSRACLPPDDARRHAPPEGAVPIAPQTWRTYADVADLFSGQPDPDWDSDRDRIDEQPRDPSNGP